MNGKVKVGFWLSDEYRKARLVESGEQLDQKQTAEFDLADATIAERTAIVSVAGVELRDIEIVAWSNLTWNDYKPTSDHLYLAGILSLTDVAGHCLRMRMERDAAQAVHDEFMRGKISADISEKIATLHEYLAERTLKNVDLANYLSLYWTERAALEYPGYVVDIENDGGWKSRACPSVEALDERDAALAAHPNITAEIVWLTGMPSDHKRTSIDEYEDDHEFESCEALIISDPAYPYDLVKLL